MDIVKEIYNLHVSEGVPDSKGDLSSRSYPDFEGTKSCFAMRSTLIRRLGNFSPERTVQDYFFRKHDKRFDLKEV